MIPGYYFLTCPRISSCPRYPFLLPYFLYIPPKLKVWNVFDLLFHIQHVLAKCYTFFPLTLNLFKFYFLLPSWLSLTAFSHQALLISTIAGFVDHHYVDHLCASELHFQQLPSLTNGPPDLIGNCFSTASLMTFPPWSQTRLPSCSPRLPLSMPVFSLSALLVALSFSTCPVFRAHLKCLLIPEVALGDAFHEDTSSSEPSAHVLVHEAPHF